RARARCWRASCRTCWAGPPGVTCRRTCNCSRVIMSNPGFSRAIVTGAGGLLGRALIARLLKDDIRVLAVDQRQPELGGRGWELGVGSWGPTQSKFRPLLSCRSPDSQLLTPNSHRVTFYRADVTNIDAWDASPETFWRLPEDTVLFHLAGIAHAGHCRQEPLSG